MIRSVIIFSMANSFTALSTMLVTSSSCLCRLRSSMSARLVSSFMSNFTLVACTSCSQCLSRMAELCSFSTALKDVNMFFTIDSRPIKALDSRVSLSKALRSLLYCLHSMSMFSTSISCHIVFFHSSIEVLTSSM